MKYFIFILFVSNSCSGQALKIEWNKYFKLFYDSNSTEFEGFRFVCDTLADNREIQMLCTELHFDNLYDTISINPDSIPFYLGHNIAQVSRIKFETFPLHDSRIVINKFEKESNVELFKLDKKLDNGEITKAKYFSKFDSVLSSPQHISSTLR